MRNRTLSLTLLAAAVLAGPAHAQRTEEFTWSGTVAAGKTVTIHNVNGEIEAAPASGRGVEVVAVKHSRRGDPSAVRIEVRETADGVTLCPIYPGETDCGRQGRNRDDDDRVSVDFAVRVPAGVHLEAGTVNGKVQVRGLTGDVRVSTVNGGIRVETAGAAEAHTVNGSIDAAVGRASWDGRLDFRTVNGSIDLALPAATGAEVEARTVNGPISADFPLAIRSERRWGPRRIEGTIGSGGGGLRLETVNGAIRLRRS
ncbi:MAG TPA: DUF4097 family beta strand repeat-containing protein [Gemmatimonadota bacterium]|nr:DUF4097 family beta strand repeat-containing protein [Gemmatimonadota bacterium]